MVQTQKLIDEIEAARALLETEAAPCSPRHKTKLGRFDICTGFGFDRTSITDIILVNHKITQTE
jgi:hypothetical protein